MYNFTTSSTQETKQLASRLVKKLQGGEVLALSGDLGSGKTTFAQGLAQGLGIKEKIQSPTFVVMKNYPINLKSEILNLKSLVHIDCYRLKSLEDALSIGIIDYLGQPNTICVIEWPEKIKKILPPKTIDFHFQHLNEHQRQITITKN